MSTTMIVLPLCQISCQYVSLVYRILKRWRTAKNVFGQDVSNNHMKMFSLKSWLLIWGIDLEGVKGIEFCKEAKTCWYMVKLFEAWFSNMTFFTDLPSPWKWKVMEIRKTTWFVRNSELRIWFFSKITFEVRGYGVNKRIAIWKIHFCQFFIKIS